MHIHFKTVTKISSLVLVISALSNVPSIICALVYREEICVRAFFATFVLFMIIGIAGFVLFKHTKAPLSIRDGYMVVFMCWAIFSLSGTVPYLLSGAATNFADALFESVAGITTTGATVINTLAVPKSVLLFKAVSHWIGGMGILFLTISVLPALGFRGFNVLKAEIPGPSFDKVTDKISGYARTLYTVYFLLTVLEFLLLVISPKMNAYEALINSLSTISTSGMIKDTLQAPWAGSYYIELIVTVFTIFASMNFVLYLQLIKGKVNALYSNVELKAFMIIIAIATILVTINMIFSNTYTNLITALRHSLSQVVSFVSTSGYSFCEYVSWPIFSQMILFFLLFIGGCGASTTGSIKVMRILVALKLIYRGFIRRLHPRSVMAVNIGNKTISGPMVSMISTFILVYMAIILVSSAIFSITGLGLEKCLELSAGMLSNTGDVFTRATAVDSIMTMPAALKYFMSFLMLIGRLEIFTVLQMFYIGFWNPDKQKN